MQIIIEIPNKDIPKHQEIIGVHLDFIDGHIVNAGGYGFEELPKGHGRLIDADALMYKQTHHGNYYTLFELIDRNDLNNTPTIIEADKARSEDKE